jgi:vitamin B12 transporter
VRWTHGRFDASASARLTGFTFHFPTNSAGVPTDSTAYNTEQRSIESLDMGWRASTRFEFRVRVAHDLANPKYRDIPRSATSPDTNSSDATVTRDLFEGRAIVRLGRTHVLTVAEEHSRDTENESSQSVSAFGSFPGSLVAKRTNDGLSTQLLGNLGNRTTYTLGLRRDDNSAFGIFTTTRVAAAVRLSSATQVRASFGTAFRAPTFDENFSTGFTLGNPHLTPERTNTREIGLEHSMFANRLTVDATAFWQRFRDLIQYDGSVAAGQPNYANLAAASADGIELESSWRVERGLGVRASYTFLNTKVTDPGDDSGEGATFVNGERLLRRPKHLASVNVHEALPGNGSVDATLTYTGERNDRDFNQFPAVPIVMKAFTLVNVAFVTPLPGTRGFERPAIVLRVDNALNTGYQQIVGFKAPGRTYFLGLRVGN